MKKILLFFAILIIQYSTPNTAFSQAKTYFHDRIDTTIFAVADTVGHGSNNYYATNTSPDFNVNHYENGLCVILFIKPGNSGAATLTLVTRTGTLSTRSIRKPPGAVITSGDLKDSCTALFTYYNGHWRLGDMIPASSSSWTLLGNAGTVAGTNFMGTTDAQDVVFKRNSSEVIRLYSANNFVGIGETSPSAKLHVKGLGATSATYALKVQNSSSASLFEVYDSGQLKAGDASNNLFLGTNSGLNINIGGGGMGNTGFGVSSLSGITTGTFNTAIGTLALSSATIGVYNVAIGYSALQDGANLDGNVAIGYSAGNNLTAVTGNTAVGYNALGTTTGSGGASIGSYNTAFGYKALETWNDATGLTTCAFGANALRVSPDGENCAIGNNALAAATTGASQNTALGNVSLTAMTTGDNNTGLGRYAGAEFTTGSGNLMAGHWAGSGFQGASSNNTIIGAGSAITGVNRTSSNNTFLGYGTGLAAHGDGNVFLGYSAGSFETGASKLFIDNQSRTNEATARTNSLIYGIFNATVTSQELHFNSGIVDINGRLETKQGTDIASSSTITITYTGNVFELTGTTAVDFITTTGWQEGSELTLIANENVTINDDAGGGNLRLAGNANFAMTADDVLTLIYSSTTAGGIIWREKSRSVN